MASFFIFYLYMTESRHFNETELRSYIAPHQTFNTGLESLLSFRLCFVIVWRNCNTDYKPI